MADQSQHENIMTEENNVENRAEQIAHEDNRDTTFATEKTAIYPCQIDLSMQRKRTFIKLKMVSGSFI